MAILIYSGMYRKYVHGTCVLSDEDVLEYKVSDYYHTECVAGIAYNNPALNIPWPITNPILSEQEKSLESLSEK